MTSICKTDTDGGSAHRAVAALGATGVGSHDNRLLTGGTGDFVGSRHLRPGTRSC
jgi:hypothetical protein